MAARKSVPSKPAPKPATKPGTVQVKVLEPFQVSDEGVTYGPGESLAVAVELAERWRVNGWVTITD